MRITPSKIIRGAYYIGVGNVTYQVVGIADVIRSSTRVFTEIVKVGSKRLADKVGTEQEWSARTFAKQIVRRWIRRCAVTTCRCVDEHACPGGCSWIAIDLCSTEDAAHNAAREKRGLPQAALA